MCTDDYTYFPVVTIGGPTGDYSFIAPIVSCRWAEFAVVGISNMGSGPPGAITVSGTNPPKTPIIDGSIKLDFDTFLHGQIFKAPDFSQNCPEFVWNRVPGEDKKVFVRIDAAANTSIYVALQFRVKPITVIPGPALTVHPDHQQQLNIARGEKTLERLEQMGIPMRIENHG